MTAGRKLGTNTGKNGGVYQEQGPQGRRRGNFATVPDDRQLPPTTTPEGTRVSGEAEAGQQALIGGTGVQALAHSSIRGDRHVYPIQH